MYLTFLSGYGYTLRINTNSFTSCPTNWLSNSGHCYLFNTVAKKWYSAQAYCMSEGGYLADIKSQTEFAYIQSLVIRYGTSFVWVNEYIYCFC
jgi:hypothetical protein